ncbi:MAG: glycosyltransferase [Bacillota bacterium]
MKKNIVILDEFFPYLNKEPFLESEINYYKEYNVHIFSCSANNSMSSREIKSKNIKFFAQEKEKSCIWKFLRYLKTLFSIEFIKEMLVLYKNNKINYTTIKQLLSFLSIAKYKYKWIKRELINLGFNKNENFIFYSYWMHYHAYTALLLKKHFEKSKVITRCHRFDLYEYRNSMDYIPLRKPILSQVDEIHSISEDGKNYLTTRYPEITMNIKISRLGTYDRDWVKETTELKPLKIISCSWVVPVKRVERIISSLEKINDISVEWTHFGNGELFNEIKKLAEEKLQPKKNITYFLEGAVSNEELLRKYSEKQYHLFVNVSESEGVPVSIMEAMSFGIPVIATNVGGVNEIVINDKNGFLLDKDFTDKQLIDLIRKISCMQNDEHFKLRKMARNFWMKNYNAEKNYIEFISEIGKRK